jgi:hypothetical protein
MHETNYQLFDFLVNDTRNRFDVKETVTIPENEVIGNDFSFEKLLTCLDRRHILFPDQRHWRRNTCNSDGSPYMQNSEDVRSVF